ncbi:AtpZ/AtpI family protein [Candidatus Pelagibacter sp.]|jgi:ATP synthase protein I|nr:AtpZ/AtpI family protein [Candidatus Pelagibacter sp.]|tara:strand:+ start:109 stop:375 length:267 start_codon:yes stop_codon:yes gene_type:complete
MGKERLKDRLKNARKKLKVEKENPQTSNIGQAFKLSTELVAAVLVGTIIGFILDNWFDTKPWLIIIFFFVGVVAGILNVIRSAKKLQN